MTEAEQKELLGGFVKLIQGLQEIVRQHNAMLLDLYERIVVLEGQVVALSGFGLGQAPQRKRGEMK